MHCPDTARNAVSHDLRRATSYSDRRQQGRHERYDGTPRHGKRFTVMPAAPVGRQDGGRTMARRWTDRALRALAVLCAGAVLTGCFGPQPPMFSDGKSVPSERRRIPLTVPPGPDGSWSLLRTRDGLLGQGRKLARIPQEGEEGVRAPVRGWTVTLPAEFAITSRLPGGPHSAVPLSSAGTVLIGGRAGRADPTAVALADPGSGALVWRHTLPPDSRVFMTAGPLGEEIGAATCSAAGCRFTAWDASRGTRQWSTRITGAHRVRTDCGADALGGASAAGLCEPLLIGKDRVGTLDEETHRPQWIPGLRPCGRDGRPGRTVQLPDVPGHRTRPRELPGDRPGRRPAGRRAPGMAVRLRLGPAAGRPRSAHRLPLGPHPVAEGRIRPGAARARRRPGRRSVLRSEAAAPPARRGGISGPG